MEIRPTLHNEALSHPWQPPGPPSPGGAEAYKTPRIDVSGNSGKWLLLDRRRTVYWICINNWSTKGRHVPCWGIQFTLPQWHSNLGCQQTTGPRFNIWLRCLIIRSCEDLKLQDLCLELSDRSEIWQAHRQQCCRGACQISKRCNKSNYQSCGSKVSRDLTIRCLIGYGNGAQVMMHLDFFTSLL